MYWACPPSRSGWNHQLTGQVRGHFAPVVLADDMEAEVDAGRTTGSREDVALIDKEHAGVDRDVRIATGQFVTVGPVGGGPSPIEQSRLRQDKGAAAERDHSAPPGVGPAKLVEHAVGNLMRPVGGGDDHCVDPGQGLQTVWNQDLEAAIRCQWARVEAADEESVPGITTSNPPILAEDLAGQPEFERGKALDEDDGDVVPLPPGRPGPHRWDLRVGRFVAHHVNLATFGDGASASPLEGEDFRVPPIDRHRTEQPRAAGRASNPPGSDQIGAKPLRCRRRADNDPAPP